MAADLDELQMELQNFINSSPELAKKYQTLNFQAPIKGSFYNSGDFDLSGNIVGRKHEGVDLRAPGGTPVYPIAPGTVSAVQEDPKGGHTVNVKHSGGYTSYYAHLGTIACYKGDMVDYDTVLGTVGISGNAKSRGGLAHCHLQVWHNGALINPSSLFSVPAYTPFNNQKEKNWLSGEAKQVADNWNMQQHLQNQNKRIANIANLFYLVASSK